MRLTRRSSFNRVYLPSATLSNMTSLKGDVPSELCRVVGQFVAGHGFGAAVGARSAIALCAAAATYETIEFLEERRCGRRCVP